ncbi:MAG: hypothetical protein AAF993_04605 [Pseudomonadota bacterium]
MLFNWVTSLFSRKNASGASARPSAKDGSGRGQASARQQQKNSRKASKGKKSATRSANRNIPTSARHPYRAVSVSSRGNGCAASKRIKNEKFLAAYAPILPLGGCTHPNQCRCRYKHYEDRRQDMRRDTDHGLPGRVWTEHDRRHRRRDRRKSQTDVSAA